MPRCLVKGVLFSLGESEEYSIDCTANLRPFINKSILYGKVLSEITF